MALRPYGRRWSKARANYLEENPWCVMCEAQGRVMPATVVDHIEPHRDDLVLFWDETNWQGLCGPHHNSVKQAAEKGRTVVLHDLNGYPVAEIGPGAGRTLG